MTTTHDVPMPEVIAYRQTVKFRSEPGRIDTFIFPIDEHPKPVGTEDLCTLDAAIVYADARCAKLQTERDALAEKVKDIDQCSATTQALIAMLIERDKRGLAKYGQTLDRTDLTHDEWLQHMAEEMLDGAGYALAAIRTNVAIDAEGDQP